MQLTWLLFQEIERNLEKAILILEKVANKGRLRMSEAKTRYLNCNRQVQKMGNFIRGGHTLEEFDIFEYLGILVNKKIERQDIKQRIQKS